MAKQANRGPEKDDTMTDTLTKTQTAFRAWRRALGWSQKRAANELGLSLDQIRNYDTGSARTATRGPQAPDRRTRLAMAALDRGLDPWPERD